MSASLPQSDRAGLLKGVDRPSPAKASLLNDVEMGGQMLRLAIMRTGLSQEQAQDALGVKDKGQFSRMLDGKETLGVHRFLRPKARAIWLEIIYLTANTCGCEVERTIRIREAI